LEWLRKQLNAPGTVADIGFVAGVDLPFELSLTVVVWRAVEVGDRVTCATCEETGAAEVAVVLAIGTPLS
jgi:hypothetical protein